MDSCRTALDGERWGNDQERLALKQKRPGQPGLFQVQLKPLPYGFVELECSLSPWSSPSSVMPVSVECVLPGTTVPAEELLCTLTGVFGGANSSFAQPVDSTIQRAIIKAPIVLVIFPKGVMEFKDNASRRGSQVLRQDFPDGLGWQLDDDACPCTSFRVRGLLRAKDPDIRESQLPKDIGPSLGDLDPT